MTEANVHARLPGVGQIYADKGFSSSTTDSEKAFGGNVQMTIKSKTGVKIEDLSAVPSEDEVLFSPGKEFTILRKEQLKDGSWEIDLEEK